MGAALDDINVKGMPALKILFGFSGPAGRHDGFDVWARRAGALLGLNVKVDMCDILNGTDLADELTWQSILADLSAPHGYQASLWSPPCSTFSVARRLPGGPPVLRGHRGPELYGLPHLKPEHMEQVRIGTLLAKRGAQGIAAQSRAGRPWILESPTPQGDCASIFLLPEIIEAFGDKVRTLDFAQCMLGASSKKPTRLASSFELPPGLEHECEHPKKWWRQPPHGYWIRAAHPPLKGRRRAVSPSAWRSGSAASSTGFVTKESAAYPDKLNAYLAAALVGQLAAHSATPASPTPPHGVRPAGTGAVGVQSQGTEFVRVGKWRNTLVTSGAVKRSAPADELFESKRRAIMPNPLRMVDDAAAIKEREEELAIGGMRKPQRSITKLPGVVSTGRKLRGLLEKALKAHPRLEVMILRAIGDKNAAKDIPYDIIDSVRDELAALLEVKDTGAVERGYFGTELRAHLLDGWRRAANDPDWAVTKWLTDTGVPAGLALHPEDCGIFPRTSVEAMPTDSLHADPSDFLPYASVEADDDAWDQVQGLVDKGWLLQFNSLDELKAFLGTEPILSKFGLVVKERNGVMKKRLILDAKSSGITGVASKHERILLPRILDVAHNVLNLQAEGTDDVELFILDFADAFWLLPLAEVERKWFTSKLRGKYFAFLRNAQGSRNAPLGWGRLAAMLGRVTQSIYAKGEALTEVYTDDPCICMRGDKQHRDRLIAMTVLLWLCLGFPLSWAKGARGPTVDWIGATFSVQSNSSDRGIIVRIKEDLFKSTLDMLVAVLAENVVPKRTLRQLTGKLSNIANLLLPWRPFLRPLYGAIYGEAGNAPLNCIWVKSIEQALRWFESFFLSTGGFIERRLRLSCYLHIDTQVDMVLDASPWGIAGILLVNGRPQEYFSDPLSEADVRIFEHQIGQAEGQQVWESLAALVALRQWRQKWQQHRVRLTVRGDNMAMLTLVVNMRPKSKQLQIVAQELALEFCHFSFVPVIAEHIPGVANKIADELSRRHQPGTNASELSFLSAAMEVEVPLRDKAYYRTLAGAPKQAGNRGARATSR